MKFKFAPKGDYHPQQPITINGEPWVVESVYHTGRNLIAHTPDDAPKFERILVILTDAKPIKEMPQPMRDAFDARALACHLTNTTMRD